MSVEQVDQVDFVSIERSSNIVVLTVSGSSGLERRGEPRSAVAGEAECVPTICRGRPADRTVPQARGRTITVEVVCKHEPTALGREFFGHTSQVLRAAQLGFRFRPLSADLSSEPPVAHT